MPSYLNRVFYPERYHGHRKRPPFFEGWYYKLIDPTEQHRYAVIPGVFLNADPAKAHAFIQVLDGQMLDGHPVRSHYFQFPMSAFRAAEDAFDVQIGPNRFTAEGLKLALEGAPLALQGELSFTGGTPWPVSWRAPGIMGPFGYLEFMECYHGVVSFDHTIHGALRLDGRSMDFTGGRGYIEKDWGQSFPRGWVWMQTNHFPTVGTCLTASIAIIPFKVLTFTGYIVGLWHEQQLYRFTTYSGAKLEKLAISDDHVDWVLAERDHRLEIKAARARGGLLHEPSRAAMHQRVEETLDGTVEVRLSARGGRTLFHETGRNAGLEVHGEVERLAPKVG